MERRTFIRSGILAGVGASIGGSTLMSCGVTQSGRSPAMHLRWCGYNTTRPFTPDVDANGRIWFGSAEHFFHLDTQRMSVVEHETAFMEGHPLSTTICQNEKVYVLGQKSPDIYVYHPGNDVYRKHALPDPESNIWFGRRVDGDARIYLFVRNRGKLLVWDTEHDRGTEIPYPDAMDLWSGFHVPGDNAIYSFTLDAKPARLVRFDLKAQKFDPPIPAPEPGLEITGVNPIGSIVFCADRFTGRIFPYDFVHRRWEEPISIPGHGKVFGFIGMGTSYRGLALYCISSYKGTMKWDFGTNTYLSRGDENIGIDGKPHHFLNKYLLLDPETRTTSYLEAPEEPGKRYPLICYSMVHNDILYITGYDLGDVYNNPAPMGEREGELCVFHSV